MKMIYIDPEYRCHTADDGTMTPVETDFFDGRCDAYIEGYRFIPEGAEWVKEDGSVFRGEIIAPWKSHIELERAQMAHERKLLAEYAEALKVLGVTV